MAGFFSDVKKAMEVCVKQGEIVNKHLKVEMNVGDVLCYGLDEKLVRSSFTYEINVMPDDETVRHLESRAKIYAEEKKKQQVDSLEKAVVDAKSKLEAAKAKAAKAKPKDANPKGKDGKMKSSPPRNRLLLRQKGR